MVYDGGWSGQVGSGESVQLFGCCCCCLLQCYSSAGLTPWLTPGCDWCGHGSAVLSSRGCFAIFDYPASAPSPARWHGSWPVLAMPDCNAWALSLPEVKRSRSEAKIESKLVLAATACSKLMDFKGKT